MDAVCEAEGVFFVRFEKENITAVFLLLQKENVCAPILFFLFSEKEKNRRAR